MIYSILFLKAPVTSTNNANAIINEQTAPTPTPAPTTNNASPAGVSSLLLEIQSGIKLKKVQRQAEAAEARAAISESNDVAAILRRRMEHVLGANADDSEASSNESGAGDSWDDD